MTTFTVYLRIPNDDGSASYRIVSGIGEIQTPVPPSSGDRMEVDWREHPDALISVKVTERRWRYPQFGSRAWPYDSPNDFLPEAHLDVIVERVSELLVDEGEESDD